MLAKTGGLKKRPVIINLGLANPGRPYLKLASIPGAVCWIEATAWLRSV